MPKSKEKPKQVLIVVTPAKRGYLVEVAGSGQPYPCLDAEGIGEAIIEILEDPDQESMELEAPQAQASSSREQQSAPEAPEEEAEAEPDRAPPPRDDGDRPEGWTAGDELLVGVLGGAAERLRNFSRWRGK